MEIHVLSAVKAGLEPLSPDGEIVYKFVATDQRLIITDARRHLDMMEHLNPEGQDLQDFIRAQTIFAAGQVLRDNGQIVFLEYERYGVRRPPHGIGLMITDHVRSVIETRPQLATA